jgi:hypothetical protein
MTPRAWIRTPLARWLAVAIAVLLVIWAATESLTTIGALTATNRELRADLRSAQQQTAAVLQTNRAIAHERDSLRAAERGVRATAETIARRAGTIEAQAATIRAIRGTKPPLRETTSADSVAYYRNAVTSADRENELLRDALEQRWGELAARDSIDRLQRAQLVLLAAAADSATAQLTRVQPLLGRADVALERSKPRCRIAGVVPCPSRTVSFVAGSVVTLAAVSRLTR